MIDQNLLLSSKKMKEIFQNPYILHGATLILGSLLVLTFAPFTYGFFAPIILAGFIWVCCKSSPIVAMWRGFLFGIGFYGVGVSWVFISIHRFGQLSILLSLLITALFITVLSFFPALQMYSFRKIYPNPTPIIILIAFPAIWVLTEGLRGTLASGFPWLYLGYSQTDSALSNYFPLIGVYGISFLVVFIAGLILTLLFDLQKRKKIAIWALIGLIGTECLGKSMRQVEWIHYSEKPIHVSLIQGNIPQQRKRDQDQWLFSLNRYQQLTQHQWGKDLIIWPESAITLPLPYSSSLINELSQKAQQHHSTLITGIPIQTVENNFYNAALFLGNQVHFYYKRHLVPFGEYQPFKNSLNRFFNSITLPLSDFTPGKLSQSLAQVDQMAIAVYICYEIAYAELVRHDLPQANILITLSNDAWFGHSMAPSQHLQIARVRSLETGRYGLFSTNNGITAIISPHGKIIKKLPAFQSSVLEAKVYSADGKTPWIYFGTKGIMSLSMVLFFIPLLINYLRRKYM